MKKLMVHNLPPETTAEKLQEIFSRVGTVREILFPHYERAGCDHCAFVEMEDEDLAELAVNELDGLSLGDCKITVELASSGQELIWETTH